MYANVLKFHIRIPHENIDDHFFFYYYYYPNYHPCYNYFPFNKITLKSRMVVCYYRHGQAVLESSSVRVRGHSVLQTPALVFFLVSAWIVGTCYKRHSKAVFTCTSL